MKILLTMAHALLHLGTIAVVAGFSYFLAHFSGLSDFVAYTLAYVCSAAVVLVHSPKCGEPSSELSQQLAQIGLEVGKLKEQAEHLLNVLEESNENTFDC